MTLHLAGNFVSDFAPHAIGPAAKRAEAAHHCNYDEGCDQRIFYRSRAAPITPQRAKKFSDSVHATLLWSWSTPGKLEYSG